MEDWPNDQQKRDIFEELQGGHCWRLRLNERGLLLHDARCILGDHPVEKLAEGIKLAVIEKHSAGASVRFEENNQVFLVSSRGPL